MNELNPQSRRPQILVLEDNPDQWFIMRWALLQQFPEVEPVWVTDPTQAICYLDTCQQPFRTFPRLILLDLYVPTRDLGLSFLAILKSHYLHRTIPVLVLSSSTDWQDIQESYQHQSNSYLIKPTSATEWLACFRQLRHYWWLTVSLP